MEWHKRTTWYTTFRKAGLTDAANEVEFLQYLLSSENDDCKTKASSELKWARAQKPYYNMWPAVCDGLTRVRLDVPCDSVVGLFQKLPKAISLRFPVGKEPCIVGALIHEVLIATGAMTTFDGRNGYGFVVWCDTGRRYEPTGEVLDFGLAFAFRRGWTVEDAIRDACQFDEVLSSKQEVELTAVRLAIGLAMIHDNPDMVEAVVLRKDQAKYQATRDPKYVEKAKRRGEYGFNVGANIEVLPHFRRPHFAIRWTGKGSEVPKLVPVKGCVVKRSKFTEVPTGYQADEEMALAGERADG